MRLHKRKERVPHHGDDRGKAKFFHGRVEEKKSFIGLMKETSHTEKGISFLVQGSPDVGKTALIEELKKIAIVEKWRVCDISIECLWDNDVFYEWLSKNNSYGSWNAWLGLDFFIFKAGVKRNAEINDKSMLKVIQKIKSKPTLIVLDEAQILGNRNKIPVEYHWKIEMTLKELHNLQTKKGFVFLIGGLGMTKNIFKDLGISRFSNNYVFNLDPLDKVSERAIIKDWLVECSKKMNDAIIEHWIDEIVKETHGWAQHITSYTTAIFDELKESKGELKPEGLERVLTRGLELKERYYDQTLENFNKRESQVVATLLQQNKNLKSFSEENIIEFINKKLSLEELEKLYKRLVQDGIFHRNKKKEYIVPVPSMRTWLINEYGLDK